jgi:membrane-associated phospholipid phosphatase
MRHRLQPLALAALLATSAVTPLGAQADTLSRRALFTGGDLLLAGGVLLGARLIHPLDAYYQRRLQDSSTQANRKLQLLAKVVRTTAAPGAYIIGGTLYAAGRISHNGNLADLGLHGTEALVIGELTATSLKVLVGRARPYVGTGPNDYQLGRGRSSGDYKSFPSGHAVAAFAAAAAVTSETARMAPNYKWVVGPVLYGGAALVGASRMYNNMHWASDVLIGAGIGTFAGLKVVRYQHSHPGNHLDRWLLTGSIIPDGTGGHALRWSMLPDLSRPAMPVAR